MQVTKIFSTNGDVGIPGSTGDGSAISGNRNSIWQDLQNTRDDRSILLLKWDGVGDFTIRVHALMDANTQDVTANNGSVLFVPIVPGTTEPTAVTHINGTVNLGPFVFTGDAVTKTLHAYMPKLPRMRIQIRVISGTPGVDAWLIS